MWNGVDHPEGEEDGGGRGQSQGGIVQESNNNAGSSDQESFKVGEPSPNYRLSESFYTSHHYFRRDPNSRDEAECLVCAEKQKTMNASKRKKVLIKTPNNSPKGMQSHLFTKHKELTSKIEEQKAAHDAKKKQNQKEKEEKESKKGDSMKQQKLVPSGEGKNLSVEPRHDPQMQKRFDQAIVNFAAKTGVSFNALSSGNIEILIKAFFPKSTPKVKGRHCSTISRHTAREADKIRRDIFSIILSAKETCFSFSFTSDMWRNLALDSFISLTQHFITENGEYIKLVPFCEFFGKRKHTGLNIKISLEDLMKALQLEDEKYEKNIVLDNASNNKCAIRLSPSLIGHWCANHTLALAVSDTMKADVMSIPVKKVSKKCKEVSRFVRGSEQRNNELKVACKKKEIRYKLPEKQMPVRWNSQEANINSVVRLRHALQFLMFNTADGWDDEKLCLSVQEFKLGESMVKVLQPAKIATKQWERDLTPSIHLVIPEVFNIQGAMAEFKKSTDKYVAGFAEELGRNVEKRFPNCATDTLPYTVTHMLDPTYQGAILHEYDGAFDRAKEEIIKLGSIHEVTERTNVPAAVNAETEESSTEENLTPAQRLLRKQKSRPPAEVVATNPVSQAANVRRELDEYLMMETEDTQEILTWWIRHKKRFPILFEVVRMVLAIPASSSTSERVFSQGTKICSSLRRSLAPKKVTDIMLINLNKEAIEKYKKNIGITKEYKGDLNLFSWKDELSYLDDVEETEEDLAEYDYEEVVNSDMEYDSDSAEEIDDD